MQEIIVAIILGIIQGLTEFLPVSSSGHIELGNAVLQRLFGMSIPEEDLTFTIVVHCATVLSTIVVFRKDILHILKALLKFEKNPETQLVFQILISMLPVLLVGLLLKDWIKSFFTGELMYVGIFLICTAAILWLTTVIKSDRKELNLKSAFLIGIAQAVAVLPGISRSGSTIATGLMLGIDKERMARFSFLMVIPPILGITLLDILEVSQTGGITVSEFTPLIFGFIAAFITGCVACQWMIKIVKKGKIQHFAYYCIGAGILAIILACT